ncbi:hypothetical protein K435DRAFT_871358 [Dendrothele bispora CBS 962.96]|uniref:Uncharacterized protein n=1 Tax=Dendrothele bispora (strain CBS 962.96) TaxID=1314807 RepID=A0A4V4HCI2_DENBC|nr:hypothetical protein K435DRAFT_871358 [Dendrothele bispora CBS 962.96]
MPRLTQETRLKAYGEAALYLLGDRDAVLRQLNVLIAEALLGLGCEIPRAQLVENGQRVLLNTIANSRFGCWYVEERRYARERPYTSTTWLNKPKKWQERAFRDPRVQTLIALNRRAEWNPNQSCGEEPVGLPENIVRLHGDRRHLMHGDIVRKGWSYLDSPCHHFIKGRKTYAEKEQDNTETRVIYPWKCTDLLSLYRSYSDDRGRSDSPDVRSDSPPPPAGADRHSSRSRHDPLHFSERSYSSGDDEDRLIPSSSPSPVISRSDSYHRLPSLRARKQDPRSKGIMNPFGASAASARRKSLASIPGGGPLSSFSGHRASDRSKYKAPTRRAYDTSAIPFGAPDASAKRKGSASVKSASSSSSLYQTPDSGKHEGADMSATHRTYHTPLKSFGTSDPARRRSSTSVASSSSSFYQSPDSGKYKALHSSPTWSLTAQDSDSDLPSMEDLLQEFSRKWVVIGIIWMTAGQHGEPFLITVTNGKCCLEDQQAQLKKLRIGPNTDLERLDSSWKRVSWWEMFSVKEEEKVYLRVTGVGYGMGMPNPDVLEIEDSD